LRAEWKFGLKNNHETNSKASILRNYLEKEQKAIEIPTLPINFA